MAPRNRFLDLERHDVLFFYGDGAYCHQSDRVSVATYGIVFWPVFLVAAVLLHLTAPSFAHAAAVCGAFYVAYCFLLDRAAQASSFSSSWSWPSAAAAGPPAEPDSRTTTRQGKVAGYTVVQN